MLSAGVHHDGISLVLTGCTFLKVCVIHNCDNNIFSFTYMYCADLCVTHDAHVWQYLVVYVCIF